MLSEFSSGQICACYLGLGHFHLYGANLQMQTHLVPKVIHQNLGIILWQSITAQNSFIALALYVCRSANSEDEDGEINFLQNWAKRKWPNFG